MNPTNDPTGPPDPSVPAPEAWHDTRRGLTLLQIDLLQMAASGYTDADMQSRHFLTADALRQEFTAAERRLGAKTRLHAVAKAFRGGWIS